MKNKPVIVLGIIISILLFVALILTPLYKKVAPKKALPVTRGKIAIVIDDWGYHLNNLEIIKEINEPLTCAILPNLKNSNLVAQQLNKLGFEIILHLPMQPKEKYNLENDTILSAMGLPQIRGIINKDLKSVAFAKGISNHMGSQITENKEITSIIIAETKRRKLYFLDSFVTAKSACSGVAKDLKVKFAKRDIFLDNQSDPEYIKIQIIKLKNLAARHGFAIGIGHDRKTTLMVLKEMLPQLKRQGYKFVFVSELAK